MHIRQIFVLHAKMQTMLYVMQGKKKCKQCYMSCKVKKIIGLGTDEILIF